jgi:hypothetical protein
MLISIDSVLFIKLEKLDFREEYSRDGIFSCTSMALEKQSCQGNTWHVFFAL